ncbi:MAG: two-component system response regulator [Deltaproteobacteria bacterium HGW-Deltaproteobacteria-4]|nr:MAG: two-component system response regulator [Deltaproteobacteria bacterium HGW-Deltaproteobacteria-4]
MPASKTAGKIFIVDDDRFVLESVTALLREYGFIVHPFASGQDAVKEFVREPVDLVLTDINMPEMDGIELLEKIRFLDNSTPVLLMTAYADLDVAVKAIQKGAFDFIIKPYRPPALLNAIEKGVNYKRLTQIETHYKSELEQTVARRTAELNDALGEITRLSHEIIKRLTSAVEMRDAETGLHINRISAYARRIAEALGMDDEFIAAIAIASSMHDIGKIGIADSILLKPGKLSDDEFAAVREHTSIGERILSGSSHRILQMGAKIAATHHERWDGSGYPRGLRGEEIPLVGRIVILADQYDALRNPRIYKEAIDHAATCRIILHGDGRTAPQHFDPEILAIFNEIKDDFDKIYEQDRESLPHQ